MLAGETFLGTETDGAAVGKDSKATIKSMSRDVSGLSDYAAFIGDKLQFRKSDILTDDMASEVTWLVQAVEHGIVDEAEARERLGYAPRTPKAGTVAVDDATQARDAAEVSQKVYLAVANNVLDREEGRELIQRAGANLKENTNV